ncbi:hypothetical protein B296_00047486 [Ensete ventricosum]|uniref:Uncharacterized protein n=1 Tax=Ensete ventricosum TaxID=4639 RepID=A0A426YA41_ENSVE|nr:hypothetical protein B296_00047486 [Ensete ventricosum]
MARHDPTHVAKYSPTHMAMYDPFHKLPHPILLPPSMQELRDQIGGVSLKRIEEKDGRLATARPPAGVIGHGLGDAHKGQSLVASPQGAAHPRAAVAVTAHRGKRRT